LRLFLERKVLLSIMNYGEVRLTQVIYGCIGRLYFIQIAIADGSKDRGLLTSNMGRKRGF